MSSYPIMSANRPKAVAKKLRVLMQEHGKPVSLGASLDLVSRAYGHKDWNALSASISVAGDVVPTPELVAGARHRAVSVLARAGFTGTAASIVDEIGLFGRTGTDEDGTHKALDKRIFRELAKVPFLKGPSESELGATFARLAERGHDLWEFAALLRGSAVNALADVDLKALQSGAYKRSWGFVDAVWYERMVRISERACADSLVMRSEPDLFEGLGMDWSTLASRDRGLVESIEALKAAHRLGGTMAHVIAFHGHETGFGLRQEAFPGTHGNDLVQAGEPVTTGLMPHTGLGAMLLVASEGKGVAAYRHAAALNRMLLRLFAFGDDISMSFNCVVARMLGVDHLVRVDDMGAKSEIWREVAYLVPTSAAKGEVGERERFLDVHGVHTRETLPVHLGIASDELRMERIRVEPVDEQDFGDFEPPSFLRAVALCLPWIERHCPAEMRYPVSVDRVALLHDLVAGYAPDSTIHRMGNGRPEAWADLIDRSVKAATRAQLRP